MKRKVLITVKTYPTPSKNYSETVCTAGIDEEGNWLRIYPVRFRQRPYHEQYKKWDWLSVDIVRNDSDFRAESHKLVNIDQEIQVLDHVDSAAWDYKKELLLKRVYDSKKALIDDAYDDTKKLSIAVFKPKCFAREYCEAEDRDWSSEEKAKMDQLDIFVDSNVNPLKKVPYSFGYEFYDCDNTFTKMRILDWEIGQLYWNCMEKEKDETNACKKVLEKLKSLREDKDIYLILGTTLEYHRMKAPNPFTIIGLFYPPFDDQLTLFPTWEKGMVNQDSMTS